ncbi:hypothetical protein PSDT_1380 [Parascardovia denticolens DSM 10105 = JCM 12538]|nr:hypothetical protein PSDT_1380 [Parascardovia denticolens DSM 10105 = JCM 12538]
MDLAFPSYSWRRDPLPLEPPGPRSGRSASPMGWADNLGNPGKRLARGVKTGEGIRRRSGKTFRCFFPFGCLFPRTTAIIL